MAEDQAIPIQNQSNPDSKTVESSNLEVKIESITPVSNVNGPGKENLLISWNNTMKLN